MKKQIRSTLILLSGWVILLLAVLLTGCGRSEPEPHPKPQHKVVVKTLYVQDSNLIYFLEAQNEILRDMLEELQRHHMESERLQEWRNEQYFQTTPN